MLGDICQSHTKVSDMGMFGDDTLDELFGNVFSMNMPETQVKKLDDYWVHGNVQAYYSLLNNIKQMGYKVYRNSNGKHIIKR